MKKLRALIIAMMICILGTIFTACTPDYSKLQITATYTQNQEGALSLSQGETKSITYNISNMPNGFSPDLNLSLTSNKVQAKVERTNQKDGIVTVSVTAISYGDCILRATTNEGGKFVDVQIKVELAVEDFVLKDETKLFVVKGTSNPKDLLLDNSCFSFSPIETTQKQILWYDAEGNQITKLSAQDFVGSDQKYVKIYAKSPYLEKTLEVEVEIIDEIQSVEIFSLTEKTDNGNIVLEKGEQILYNENQTNVLRLVTNKSDFARKYIRLCVTCGKNELLKNQNSLETQNIALATTIDTILTGEENFVPYFDISLQALREGQTVVNFEVSYQGYSGYKVTKTFVLDVVSAPEKILVNDVDQSTIQTQILYDNINSTVVANLGVGLIPSTAIFDKIEFEFDLDGLDGNFDDYVSLTYAGENIDSNTILTNLSEKLLAKGKKSTQGKEICATLKLSWGQNYGINHGEDPIKYTIKFEVKTGATVLNLMEQYVQDGIYIDIDKTSEVIFDGLYVNEIDSWTDGLEIYNVSSQNVVEISEYQLGQDQYIYDKVELTKIVGKKIGLKIKTLEVGTSRYNIYLPNGVSKSLTIHVVQQPKTVSVDVAENQNITQKQYSSTGILEKVTLMLDKTEENYVGTLDFVTIIDGQAYQYAYIDNVMLEVEFEPENNLTYSNGKLTITLDNVKKFEGKALSWTISKKVIKNFVLEDDDQSQTSGEIDLLAFAPIENVQFSSTELNLYSKSQLGYNYKEESTSQINLEFNPTGIKEEDCTITWDASIENYFSESDGILTINQYGYYDTKEHKFTLDVTDLNPASFYVYATIKYYGQTFVRHFKVNPLKYTQVTAVKLENFVGVNGIYLSPTQNSVDLFTYVLPSDAVHQELIYKFEPNLGSATNIVKLTNITDSSGYSRGVNISYGNNGGGSGYIVIIAKSTITDQSQTPQSALYIPVQVGDGSFKNPFKISTAEEFLAIGKTGLDKHYVIENTIDLSGYSVNFGKFTGTIDGNGTGKICGLDITAATNGYAGMFSQIGPKNVGSDADKNDAGQYITGQIKNIVIEGSLNLQINDKDLLTQEGRKIGNIGFVCGELLSGARLENVSVVLNSSKIYINTSNQLNIGGIVGKNNGEIISVVDYEGTIAKLSQNICLLNAEKIQIDYICDEKMKNDYPSNFGAMVGLNDDNGKISKQFLKNVNLVGDSNYLVKAQVNVRRIANTNDTNRICMNVGMICGTNKGNITSYKNLQTQKPTDQNNYTDYIKTYGKIQVDSADDCLVGGLVACNNGGCLEYCVTRAKVWIDGAMSSDSAAFVGGIYGKNENSGTIDNCVIQALEDVTALGINATLLYSKSGLTEDGQIDPTRVSVYGAGSVYGGQLGTGVSNLYAITYIGEKLDVNDVVLVSGRKMVKPYDGANLTVITSDNYYGDIFVGDYNKVGENYAQQKFESRSAVLVLEATQNKLFSEHGSELATYVFIKQAKNKDEQQYLTDYNTIALPFDFDGEISVVSFDSNIVRVQSNGTLVLLNSGLCKLRITSNLNTKIYKDVYVFVASEFDKIDIYKHSAAAEESAVLDGGVVTTLSDKNIPLIVKFTHEAVEINGYDIQLTCETEPNIENVIPEDVEQILFDLQKVGSVYILKNFGLNGSQEFVFKLSLNTVIKENVYTSLYSDGDDTKGYLTYTDGADQKEYEKYFTAISIQGTTDIKLDNQQISVEPSDSFDIALSIQTDKFDESIQISTNEILGEDVNFIICQQKSRIYTVKASTLTKTLSADELNKLTKISENIYKFDLVYCNQNTTKSVAIYINLSENKLSLDNIDYFEKINLNLIANQFDFQIYNQNDNTNIDINKLLKLENIVVNYTISFDNNVIPDDYVGSYFVTFLADSTGISCALQIDIMQQSITKVVFESFEGANADDIDNGNQQSPYISPGTPNHFRINVVPSIAEYDYLTITSASDKFLFALIDQNGDNLEGATLLQNGLKIDRSLTSGNVYIKYLVGSSDVANGQVYNFDVIAYKDGEDVYKISKSIIVKFAKDVTMEIVGKQKYDDVYYLARGCTYDIDLGIYGYDKSEIIVQSSRSDLISVDLENNKLSVTNSNILYQTGNGGVSATITVYGKKTVDGDVVYSNPDELNIMIVEYLVLENDSTIINQGSDGVVNVAMGDHYTFGTSLVNGINAEFSSSILEIPSTIKNFTDEVTQNATWEYQLAKKSKDGTFYFDDNSSWTKIEGEVPSEDTDNNFVIKNTNGKFVFLPLKVNALENSRYRFRISYGYEYNSGVAVYQQYNLSETRPYGSKRDVFTINVYQLGSIDSPTPIYSEKELFAMQDGVYYILMEDIELSSNFTPIDKQIAGLDGNGKNIIYSSNYSAVDKTKYGLFETIYEDSLIRNINLQIKNSLRFTIEGTSGITFGLLAGENNGIITNCSVETLQENTVRLVLSGMSSSSVYVGGLVGANNGYISNSRVSLNITASSNLAGFACSNNGKIASSCMLNSLIINTSTDANSKTSGFVCYNSGNKTDSGIIITSYSSGVSLKAQNLTIYANDTSKQIRSSTETAGFVYQNEGKITDCYSNIPISTSSRSAGFVFKNTGLIYSSYSTSMLKSLSQESYGFVYDNAEGTINGCKYLVEAGLVNYSINPSNTLIDGIQVLDVKQFANKENFDSYAISQEGNLTKGNWFFPLNSNDSTFNIEGKQFVIGRPELVSPNIVASSLQGLNLEATVTDEETGEVTYVYDNIGEERGSIHNPYIIINAQYFEDYILNSSSNKINTKYFRLVCDIDCESVLYSKLYEITFAGDIEGNGILLSEYVIDNMNSVASGGLFAKVGNGISQQGCIKNLMLKPKFINLPNGVCVGGLAGTLDGGTLCNVSIDGSATNSTLVVLGKNIVGGLVGRAINNFNIVNCTSSISANSTYRSKTILGEIEEKSDKIGSYYLIKAHTTMTMAKTSYAGCLAGVLAGSGTVNNVSISGNVAAIAEFAGLLFGGIGNGVSATNISQTIHTGQFIQAAVYGGVIAGECYGKIQDVTLESSSDLQNFFRNVPFTAYAVGGIVGLLGDIANLPELSREGAIDSGLSNVNVNATFTTGAIKSIGGLVGEFIGGKIEKSGFVGSVYGFEKVGGLIGAVMSEPTANIRLSNQKLKVGDVANKQITMLDQCFTKNGMISAINDNTGMAFVGGLVGYMEINKNTSGSYLISNCYTRDTIKIKSDFYGTACELYAGGLIGKVSEKTNGATDGDFFVKMDYCFADSKILMDIRDLKESATGEGKANLYNIYYGEIIASSDLKTVYTFVDNKSSVKFAKYNVNNGEDGHTINLSYYQSGMKSYQYALSYNTDETYTETNADNLIHYNDLLNFGSSTYNAYIDDGVKCVKFDKAYYSADIEKFFEESKSKSFYLQHPSNLWKELKLNNTWILVLGFEN